MERHRIDRIRDLVAELDAAVPREGAHVQMSQYGGGPDESKIVANQAGYLRLGVEFLRAAVAEPAAKSPGRIEADIGYLMDDASDVGFDWFERREDWEAPRAASPVTSKLISAGFALALAAVLVLTMIGLATAIRWMVR